MENTFGRNIIPQNEEERLENLKKYKILYTKSEPIFDQLAAVAATMLKVPLAMINFVDKDHVWTKADQQGDWGTEVERGTSLCSLAILKGEVTVFEDALAEPCLMSNPLVVGEFGLRFYAAVPITTAEGFNIGAVCIVDKKIRTFTPQDRKKLEWIAQLIQIEIEKRA
ncbi:serine/threonine protein kinase [Pedobacter lusitanus]|uniref:Contig30, whole genome shotgun sequence n=1 Tax=Pedobacter lusitanus TaxID=1503925 RepID=A0A0D0GTA1_9SPHI|nr:GAF domain-containing protein [Pedobacter lusitanus]KIO77706.1 serine/threonine protein kinase [Pedobacter lusitanus]